MRQRHKDPAPGDVVFLSPDGDAMRGVAGKVIMYDEEPIFGSCCITTEMMMVEAEGLGVIVLTRCTIKPETDQEWIATELDDAMFEVVFEWPDVLAGMDELLRCFLSAGGSLQSIQNSNL